MKKLEDFHVFPEDIKLFQDKGYIKFIKGGDKVIRQQLTIKGYHKGYGGQFEFMKEPNGFINHRYFRPKK